MYLPWTIDVPGVYLWCTLRLLFRWSGPPHGGGLLTVSPSRTGRGPGGRGIWVLRVDAVRVLARDTALSGTGPPGGRAVARVTARQAPGRRANLRGAGSAATARPVPGQPAQPVPAGLPAVGADSRRPGSRGGTGDGPQSGLTVYPGSRTCRYSTPLANPYSNPCSA